jgi:hypothetical protein
VISRRQRERKRGHAKSPKVRKESNKRKREKGTNPCRKSSKTGRSPSRSEERNKSKEMKTMIREIREDTAKIERRTKY